LALAATRERSRSGGGGVVIVTFPVTLNPHFCVLNVPQQITPSRPSRRRLRSGAPSSWRSARRQRHRQSRLRRGALTAAHQEAPSRPSSRRPRLRALSSWRSARRQRHRQSRLQRGALTAAHQEAPSRPPSRRPRLGATSSWRSARRQRHRQSRLQRGALTAAHQEAPSRPPSRNCSPTPVGACGARALLTKIWRRRLLVTRNFFIASLVGARALWRRLAREAKTMRAFPNFNPIVISPRR
jgi:hypothetical protein